MSTIVGILTDFGNSDIYTGVVKGVLLGINKKIIPVDLCSNVEPFNIKSASYLLYSGFDYFPEGTIFLAVVDPGVGGTRNEIAGIIDGKYIVCPDNGTISLLCRMKNSGSFYKINADEVAKFTKRNINPTFHGRDIFAPACGIISKNGFGKICREKIKPVLLDDFETAINKNKITGKTIHIDRYGNCITSIHKNDTANAAISGQVKINKTFISAISTYYEEVKPGNVLAYWGSSGFLEVAVRGGSASRKLFIKQNDPVELSRD